jgi:hypothetical protein
MRHLAPPEQGGDLYIRSVGGEKVRLVQAPKQLMGVAVARDHREVRDELACMRILPLGPQPGQHQRQAIGPGQVPPDALTGFSVGFGVPSGEHQTTMSVGAGQGGLRPGGGLPTM